MDERLLSVNRVMHAMEELDHSELTRGDVKAASRAIDSMHSELKKDRGMDSLTDAFKLLLNMAERGNWTELGNARKNGKVKAARDEVTNLARFFTDNSGNTSSVLPVSITPGHGSRKQMVDRGYPPQHTAESEQEYQQRRRVTQMEHRDRRPLDSPLSTPESYHRPRDDPKQVSAQVSRIAQERLKNSQTVELQDLNSPQHIADMYTEIYNREWASAYEELNQSYRDGAETIKHLLQILEKAYEYCKKTAERQLVNLLMHTENEMLYPNITANSRASLEAQQRPDSRLVATVRDADDLIKEFRHYTATASMPVIKWLFYEEVMKSLQPAHHSGSSQVSYIDRCVEVTWLMSVQNPPMHLEFCNPGERAPRIFRPFTKNGKYVQNCVWPALFLNRNGTLIEKGIAHLA